LKLQPALAASGGEEVSCLAAEDTVAGSNIIARVAVAGITPGNARFFKQFRQTDSRQVEQMSTGTTTVVAATIRAIRCIVARIATSVEAVRCGIAGIAVGKATTIQQTFERIQTAKFEATSSAAVCTARIAVCCVTRFAVRIKAVAGTIARIAK
jgi:hypothetical protein